jgi:hypothetical protein
MSKAPTKISVGMALSMLDRAVKERMSARTFGRDEIAQAVAFFDPDGKGMHCLYCGGDDPTRWDHFIPVNKGGDTVLGNMVRACKSCDDSKQHKTLDEWFASEAPKRPALMRKPIVEELILRYQQHFGYVPREFLTKLSENQASLYEGFRRKADELRAFLSQHGLLRASPPRG